MSVFWIIYIGAAFLALCGVIGVIHDHRKDPDSSTTLEFLALAAICVFVPGLNILCAIIFLTWLFFGGTENYHDWED